MPSFFQAQLARLGRTFASLTAGQKVVTILAVVALVGGAVFVSTWAGRPSYAPLFTGLASADASKVVESLETAGVQYQLADGGNTILVPRDVVYAERVRLSGEGLPAGDTTTGYPLLDKQGITASEFQQQVGFQRALEGELTKTIQAIDGVQTAVVHLAIPKKDVFADADGKPTASVLVKTRPGEELNPEQVQSVVNLVSSSVEGLEPGKVTVSDASGRVLSASNENGGASGDLRARQTKEYEQRLTDGVREALERVVGPGNAVVQVTADLDYDTTTTKTRQYTDPNVKPLAESSNTETLVGGNAGGTPVGVLGPDNAGNVDGTVGEAGTGSEYEKGSKNVENALNQTDQERQAAPGGVRKLGIGVLLNAKVAGGINPQDIQDLVSSAASLDRTRGDTIAITRLPFDDSAQKQAAEELAKQEADAKQEALMKSARTGALVFVIFVLLMMALLGGRKRSKAASALRRAELAAMQKRMDQLEMERLRSIEAGNSAIGELEAYDAEGERMAQVRNEIGDLVEAQPDEVAALLRGWLADRRS